MHGVKVGGVRAFERAELLRVGTAMWLRVGRQGDWGWTGMVG